MAFHSRAFGPACEHRRIEVSNSVYAGVLAMTLALTACDKGPTAAYIEMTTSAQMGDKKGFLKGFTKTSKTLVDANITLTEAYGMNEFNPFRLIVFDAVDGEPEIYDKGNIIGKKYRCPSSCALLYVRTNKRKRKILMIKEEDAGRIDMKELAQFWKTEKKKW